VARLPALPGFACRLAGNTAFGFAASAKDVNSRAACADRFFNLPLR
jgi:hypothetical protein